MIILHSHLQISENKIIKLETYKPLMLPDDSHLLAFKAHN